METLVKIVGSVVLVVFLVVVIAVLGAYPTKWLVNYLFTPHTINMLFGVSALDFWRALALNILCGILFRSSTSSSK